MLEDCMTAFELLQACVGGVIGCVIGNLLFVLFLRIGLVDWIADKAEGR